MSKYQVLVQRTQTRWVEVEGPDANEDDGEDFDFEDAWLSATEGETPPGGGPELWESQSYEVINWKWDRP